MRLSATWSACLAAAGTMLIAGIVLVLPPADSPAPPPVPKASVAVPDRPPGAAGGDRQAAPENAGRQTAPESAVRRAASGDAVRDFRIRHGDTLATVLQKAGVSPDQIHDVATALGRIFDLRKLRPGQVVRVTRTAGGDIREVFLEQGLTEYAVSREHAGRPFEASKKKKPLKKELVFAQGAIDASLYASALRAKVPSEILDGMIGLYSWSVDFQREIRRGDAFEVLYERFSDPAGKTRVHGEIVYAKMTLSGDAKPLYRFEATPGTVAYYDDRGQGIRRALLRTPINGARLSSRYGKRRHPISGYTHVHRGVDFAAPHGTPIFAAGDGVVTYRGRNGGYGKYVRIRHSGTYSTAYAHLSRYRSGVTKGVRVRQGQVIGYVGSTGRSTGPHLHYEVLVNNRQINPLSLKMPAGRKLAGAALARFRTEIRQIARQVAESHFPDAAELGSPRPPSGGSDGAPEDSARRETGTHPG